MTSNEGAEILPLLHLNNDLLISAEGAQNFAPLLLNYDHDC